MSSETTVITTSFNSEWLRALAQLPEMHTPYPSSSPTVVLRAKPQKARAPYSALLFRELGVCLLIGILLGLLLF
jgi:hypothetical protein